MDQHKSRHIRYPRYVKYVYIGYLVLMANTGYLAAFHHYSYLYFMNVLVHILLGGILLVPFAIWMRRFILFDAHHGKPFGRNAGRLGYLTMFLAFLSGLYLLYAGNASGQRTAFWLHALLGIAACLFCISSIRRAGYNISVENLYHYAGRWGLVVFIIAIMSPILIGTMRSTFPSTDNVIENSVVPPTTLADAAMGGVDGPFYPSPAETMSGRTLDAHFDADSLSCATKACHADIFAQWKGSAHQTGGFAKAWIRDAVARWQQVVDSSAARYCAGCHDPGILFNGQSERIADRPAAGVPHAGVTCTICHGIRRVKGTHGNGAYALSRPLMLQFARAPHPALKWLHDALMRWSPESHARSLLRPFHIEHSSEFCAACHKVSLSPALQAKGIYASNYYDSWLAGPFAGPRALAFFQGTEKMGCVDCHMPLVPSKDPGAQDGYVRSHEFRGMYGATKSGIQSADHPLARFAEQLRRHLELDVVAWHVPAQNLVETAADGSPADRRHAVSRTGRTPDLATDAEDVNSDALRVDVILRSKNIGHFVALGAYRTRETLVRVALFDNNGKVLGETLFPRAPVAANGPPVPANFVIPPGVSTVPTLMPGAARVFTAVFPLPPKAHKMVRVRSEVILRPKDPRRIEPETPAYEIIEQQKVDNDHAGAAAADEKMHTYMIAARERIISPDVVDASGPAPRGRAPSNGFQNWTAYGAGLLLRGEAEAAVHAFRQAMQQQETPDGLVNLGRAWLEAGNFSEAERALQQALELAPDFGRAHFFLGVMYKQKRNLDAARKHLRNAARALPGDIACSLELGHTYYLQNELTAAIRVLRRVVLAQPENAPAHYFRMRASELLGRKEKAEFEKKMFDRYSLWPAEMLEKAVVLYPFTFLPMYRHDTILAPDTALRASSGGSRSQ